MPPPVLAAGQTYIPNNADEPTAGNKGSKTLLPNPVKLAQKFRVILHLT